MTDTSIVLIATIPATASVIAATIAAVVSVLNSRSANRTELQIAKIRAEVLGTKDAMTLLEKNTNSMKDALIKVVGESEFAKGKLEGKGSGEELPESIKRQEREES